jgi:hypothetical protein
MRFLVWNYPQEDGTVGYEKRTEAEAISHQREYAFKKHDFIYASDQEALDDYICVNWAYWVEEL